jgi:hypothetical protein
MWPRYTGNVAETALTGQTDALSHYSHVHGAAIEISEQSAPGETAKALGLQNFTLNELTSRDSSI